MKYIMKSEFAPDIERFLSYKRSLGYRYLSEALVMERFDRFCLSYGVAGAVLSRELAEAWGSACEGEHPKSQHNRITLLRQFAEFLKKDGKSAHVLQSPARTVLKSFVPYIFTKQELMAIFKIVDKMTPTNNSPHISEVLPIMFRLLYGCGLRISEVCNLKKDNIDLKAFVLTITESKGGKNRLVPLPDSLSERLYVYLEKMECIYPNTEYVFPNRSGNKYAEVSIYARFREAMFKAGISHAGRGKGPRLHDLRHTFAVHSLQKMAEDGMDLYCALPILSTYLGHNEITSTEKYLRMTQEAHRGVLEQVFSAYGNIAPLAKPEVIK